MALFTKEGTPTSPRPQASRGDGGAASSGFSVIGPGLKFDGKVTGSENLIVEGEVVGGIDIAAEVRIARTGRVEATVHARNVAVEGTVVGDLSADNRVELAAGSNVDGNIRAPKIVVAEGAKFRGAVDMGVKDEPKQNQKEKA